MQSSKLPLLILMYPGKSRPLGPLTTYPGLGLLPHWRVGKDDFAKVIIKDGTGMQEDKYRIIIGNIVSDTITNYVFMYL